MSTECCGQHALHCAKVNSVFVAEQPSVAMIAVNSLVEKQLIRPIRVASCGQGDACRANAFQFVQTQRMPVRPKCRHSTTQHYAVHLHTQHFHDEPEDCDAIEPSPIWTNGSLSGQGTHLSLARSSSRASSDSWAFCMRKRFCSSR